MKQLIFLFSILFSLSSFAQIDRVEPPFWWSDMHQSSLQIMFYGKNIAQFEVSASKEVVIENVLKTENANYLFVTINTKELPAGSYFLEVIIENQTFLAFFVKL